MQYMQCLRFALRLIFLRYLNFAVRAQNFHMLDQLMIVFAFFSSMTIFNRLDFGYTDRDWETLILNLTVTLRNLINDKK